MKEVINMGEWTIKSRLKLTKSEILEILDLLDKKISLYLSDYRVAISVAILTGIVVSYLQIP